MLLPSSYTSLDMLRVRRISHLLKLAVKECMKITDGPLKKIRAVLNSLCASVKRKDEFSAVGKELDMEMSLPTVDCETRWSSTFTMV